MGRKWRFNHELSNGYSWEIIPDAGIAAGNVFTYGEAGFLVRWGRGLKADWGPEMDSSDVQYSYGMPCLTDQELCIYFDLSPA